MKTYAFSLNRTDNSSAVAEAVSGIDPQLVIMFFSPGHIADHGHLHDIAAKNRNAIVIGCSTAGEIHNKTLGDESLSGVALHFDKSRIKAASAEISSSEASFEAGKKIGEELKAPDLAGVFVLCPGLNINGSEFVKGVISALGKDIPLSGGLAGDGVHFQKTATLLDDSISMNRAVAVGFYGDALEYKTSSRGGWNVFGPARRVTKSEGNILYELDNKPALALYEEYLGDKAADLPSSGLLYPFAILQEDHSELGLIRTILNIDRDKESLILAGDLPQGSLVCLMHADIDNLIDGAETAASEVKSVDQSGDSATLMVSCVGRKLVMNDDVIEELDAVRGVLGKNSVYAGFYSYGEICPFTVTGQPELHNQTMTITHLWEKS